MVAPGSEGGRQKTETDRESQKSPVMDGHGCTIVLYPLTHCEEKPNNSMQIKQKQQQKYTNNKPNKHKKRSIWAVLVACLSMKHY